MVSEQKSRVKMLHLIEGKKYIFSLTREIQKKTEEKLTACLVYFSCENLLISYLNNKILINIYNCLPSF